jgi:parvulin-like peptidyl-prolyl isomerase
MCCKIVEFRDYLGGCVVFFLDLKMEGIQEQFTEIWTQFLASDINQLLSKKIFFIFTGWHIVLFISMQLFKNVKNIFPSGSTGGKGTVSASHILVKDESKAKELMKAIKADPEKFEKLAEENSTCPSGKKGGDLGSFKKGQMVKEFEAVCSKWFLMQDMFR